MGNKPISFSLVVPVYDGENEGYDIFASINAMNAKLSGLLSAGAIKDYELVVIMSFRRLFADSHLQLDKRIRFVYQKEREKVELGNMFKMGIWLAKKECVGLITPYNQVDLGILDNIVEALKNHDMVVAYISNHFSRPWYRIAASQANTILVNLLFGLKLKYYHLNFYRTDLVKRVEITTDSHAAMIEAAVWLAKSNISIAQIPFTMIPHNFKSKSRAFRIKNIYNIFMTYFRLFWRIRILKKRIDLS